MNKEKYPLAYACYNKNTEIRLNSTSGGIFTLIAEYIINKCGGVVFGAAFDNSFAVRHIMVETTDELKKLRGSKYPQSIISNCYILAKQLLDSGRTVFFTGTPCQIMGLKCYLKKEYNNLYCMDFICHGVASPLIWHRYLEEWRDLNRINYIVFKDKIKGWKKWHVKIEYDNHVWYCRGSFEPFMQSYLQYANIRPSCYKCKFKGLKRVSDFTISDCWGIGEKNKVLNDDRGLSALLLQNERAEVIFENIKNSLIYEQYDVVELMRGNWTAFESVQMNENRKKFFDLFAKKGAKVALRKYFSPSLQECVRYNLMRLKGKVK